MSSRQQWAITRISGALEELGEAIALLRPSELFEVANPNAARALSNLVKARVLYKARRRRDKIFPQSDQLFADPAWDILLDVFIANEERRPAFISSTCAAAACPATTALRWIKALEKMGLLRAKPDRTDGRRRIVELTDEAKRAMQEYLEGY